MKLQQINNPSEFEKLVELVHSLGFVIIKPEGANAEVEILPDLSFPRPSKFLVLSDQIDLLVFRAVKDYFVVDQVDSPIIALDQNRLVNQTLQRGRFYFTNLEGFAPFWVSPLAAQLHREGYTLQM
jgi:hypothetical protein